MYQIGGTPEASSSSDPCQLREKEVQSVDGWMEGGKERKKEEEEKEEAEKLQSWVRLRYYCTTDLRRRKGGSDENEQAALASVRSPMIHNNATLLLQSNVIQCATGKQVH